MEAGRGLPPVRLARLQRGDDPLRSRVRLADARRRAGRVGGMDEDVPVARLLRPAARELRAAVRSSVLARVGRFPRHPRRATCAARASTTSRTRGGRRSRSARTPSTIRTSGRATARTSGDSPRPMGRATGRSRSTALRASFFTYAARGAAGNEVRDDGTIAPTAAGGSVPFAPEITIPALIAMREKYGDRLFAKYGFLDAFNATFPRSGLTPQTGTRRSWRRLVRHRLPRHRPGPDHRHDREPSVGARLASDAYQPVHQDGVETGGVHGGLARSVTCHSSPALGMTSQADLPLRRAARHPPDSRDARYPDLPPNMERLHVAARRPER